jgi:hypothetical protein
VGVGGWIIVPAAIFEYQCCTASTKKNVNLTTTKKTVTSACRRHKILIIGDSHVRGLLENINNCLDDSFSVIGITKPNTDIDAITSLLHLKTEKLTKEDQIIFYGGSKDISRN